MNQNQDKKIKLCALTTISKTMDWFVCDIMRTLAENGYEITLICNMDEGFAERNADFATCIDLKMSRGSSVHDLLTVPFKLRKIFKEHQFDVLYYMSPNASMYASLGGRLAHIPLRVYSQTGLRYVALDGMSRRIFKLVEKLTCRFSTHIRAQSPLNRQLAIDEGLCRPEKISVVGIGGTTGVLLERCDAFDHAAVKQARRAAYGIPADAFVYGYVGRINTDKGIGELIEAFERVQADKPGAYLALVGMIDTANAVRPELLERARANDHIVFTGNVPPAEVYEHMAMFDVLTHPTYREGFGKVLQEAMGMSLPIITTAIPGPSEVVEDGVSGVLVEVKNAAALAEAMERLYADADLRASLSAAGRARAERYFDRPIMLGNQLEDMNSIISEKEA